MPCSCFNITPACSVNGNRKQKPKAQGFQCCWFRSCISEVASNVVGFRSCISGCNSVAAVGMFSSVVHPFCPNESTYTGCRSNTVRTATRPKCLGSVPLHAVTSESHRYGPEWTFGVRPSCRTSVKIATHPCVSNKTRMVANAQRHPRDDGSLTCFVLGAESGMQALS